MAERLCVGLQILIGRFDSGPVFYEYWLGDNVAEIYVIENTRNRKPYVGQTINSAKRRFAQHMTELRLGRHPNSHMQKAYESGDTFDFRVVIVCEDFYADFYESELIETLGGINGNAMYNQKHGGSRGRLSEETKLKISIGNKGKTISEEHKELIRQSKLGSIPWNKGKPRTEETKRKIGESKLGSTPWNKGIPRTEETKRKISDVHRGKFEGEKNPNAKLTKQEVILMRQMRKEGASYKEVAKAFNTPLSTTKKILLKKTWVGVEWPS